MEFALLLLGLLPLVFLHEEGDTAPEEKVPQPAGEPTPTLCEGDGSPQNDVPDMLDVALSPLIEDDEPSGEVSDEPALPPLDEDDELPDFAVFDPEVDALAPLVEDDEVPNFATECPEQGEGDKSTGDANVAQGALQEPPRNGIRWS